MDKKIYEKVHSVKSQSKLETSTQNNDSSLGPNRVYASQTSLDMSSGEANL